MNPLVLVLMFLLREIIAKAVKMAVVAVAAKHITELMMPVINKFKRWVKWDERIQQFRHWIHRDKDTDDSTTLAQDQRVK